MVAKKTAKNFRGILFAATCRPYSEYVCFICLLHRANGILLKIVSKCTSTSFSHKKIPKIFFSPSLDPYPGVDGTPRPRPILKCQPTCTSKSWLRRWSYPRPNMRQTCLCKYNYVHVLGYSGYL